MDGWVKMTVLPWGGKQSSSQLNVKYNSCHGYVGRKFTEYIKLGSYVTISARVMLDKSPNCDAGLAGLICKSSQQRDTRLLAPLLQAVHVPCLFYLLPFSYLSLTLGS